MATALHLLLTLFKEKITCDNKFKVAQSVLVDFEVAFKMYPVFYTNNFKILQIKWLLAFVTLLHILHDFIFISLSRGGLLLHLFWKLCKEILLCQDDSQA